MFGGKHLNYSIFIYIFTSLERLVTYLGTVENVWGHRPVLVLERNRPFNFYLPCCTICCCHSVDTLLPLSLTVICTLIIHGNLQLTTDVIIWQPLRKEQPLKLLGISFTNVFFAPGWSLRSIKKNRKRH